MVEIPTFAESDTDDYLVDTPLGDYELIDFGQGRKLERWGPYLVESPDREAGGRARDSQWAADWVFVEEMGGLGHWQPTRSGLNRNWTTTLDGETVHCLLEARGRVGVQGRDLLCGRWVRQRIEGCYDL